MFKFCLIELTARGELSVSGWWNEEDVSTSLDTDLPPPNAILSSNITRPDRNLAAVVATVGAITDAQVVELATKLVGNGCQRVIAVTVDDLIAVGNQGFFDTLPCVEIWRTIGSETIYALYEHMECLARGPDRLALYSRPETRPLGAKVERVYYLDDQPMRGWAPLSACAGHLLRQELSGLLLGRTREFRREVIAAPAPQAAEGEASPDAISTSSAHEDNLLPNIGFARPVVPLPRPSPMAIDEAESSRRHPIALMSSPSATSSFSVQPQNPTDRTGAVAESETPNTQPRPRKRTLALAAGAFLLISVSGTTGFLAGQSVAAEQVRPATVNQLAVEVAAQRQHLDQEMTQIDSLAQRMTSLDTRLKAMEQRGGDVVIVARRLSTVEGKVAALEQTPNAINSDIQALRQSTDAISQDRSQMWDELRRLSAIVAYLRSKVQ